MNKTRIHRSCNDNANTPSEPKYELIVAKAREGAICEAVGKHSQEPRLQKREPCSQAQVERQRMPHAELSALSGTDEANGVASRS
ncbi:MAG: hypothetical protein HDQ87_01115 [Clostridia bacterium]|nr:hypothetical protein [Clostridia bacterium]